MKIFISIPMLGRSEDEIKKEMQNIMKTYFPEDELIDTVMDSGSPICCMGNSILFMDKADLVVFAKGWETTRGCTIEKLIADRYGKRVCILDKIGKEIPAIEKVDIAGNTVNNMINALIQLNPNDLLMVCGSEDKHSIWTDNTIGYSSIDTDDFIESKMCEFREIEGDDKND